MWSMQISRTWRIKNNHYLKLIYKKARGSPSPFLLAENSIARLFVNKLSITGTSSFESWNCNTVSCHIVPFRHSEAGIHIFLWSPTGKARGPTLRPGGATSRPKAGAFIHGQRPWLSAAGVKSIPSFPFSPAYRRRAGMTGLNMNKDSIFKPTDKNLILYISDVRIEID